MSLSHVTGVAVSPRGRLAHDKWFLRGSDFVFDMAALDSARSHRLSVTANFRRAGMTAFLPKGQTAETRLQKETSRYPELDCLSHL